uniref:Uncharacterized protein n=1 Tax=Oryza meridionalis TaxID=40149 RepID=A0A0E0DRC8_9ORYZ
MPFDSDYSAVDAEPQWRRISIIKWWWSLFFPRDFSGHGHISEAPKSNSLNLARALYKKHLHFSHATESSLLLGREREREQRLLQLRSFSCRGGGRRTMAEDGRGEEKAVDVVAVKKPKQGGFRTMPYYTFKPLETVKPEEELELYRGNGNEDDGKKGGTLK